MVEQRWSEQDRCWMRHALDLALEAERRGEVPVGALVVIDNEMAGEGWNRPIAANDPTAHAEITALRQAARAVGNYRLPGAILYTTLEPCPMCAGAMLHARIARVVFAAPDPRSGAAGSVMDLLQSTHFNHRCQVQGGLLETESGELLRGFFRDRRGRHPGAD